MNDAKPGFIGKSVERKEDFRFLTGSGQYTDDITLPRQSYGCFLRSPHAHARIRGIERRGGESRAGRAGDVHRQGRGRLSAACRAAGRSTTSTARR